MVFSKDSGDINDASLGWDELFDGRNAENGVYSYYAKVIYLDEIEEVFIGDVSLVR